MSASRAPSLWDRLAGALRGPMPPWWVRAAAALRWLGAPLLLALLVWSVRHLAWRALARDLAAARPAWLAGAILLQLVVLVLWAGLWRCFVPAREPVRFRTVLGAVTVTGAAMLVMPSFAGQASAAALLVRRCRLRVVSAASVMIGEQVAEAAGKAVVLGLALGLAPLSPAIRAAAQLAAVLFGGAAVLAVVITRMWRRAPAVLRHPRPLLRALGLALSIKAVEAGILVAVQRSLGVRLGVGPVLLLLALAAVGIMAGSILPVPGPVGVGEAVVAAGYTQLGLPLELSLALVAVHSACLLLPRVTGAAALLLADARRARVAARAAAIPLEAA